ncbi:carboxypeptidase regulatory-like domain-containing protein [Gemmatimonadota bacterium DH-20]|uniref:Carboxypeptidase regulatory-like domain-containing protein n=1 Tax=Gaopeijia maritima TaxID=3119007 RepID=A0ABU9E7W8_9BACT
MTACTSTPHRRRLLSALVALLAAAALAGCKDATLGPEVQGGIEGHVVDFRTGAAVAGASVTTAPPSEAILTDGSGAFVLDGLEAGTYQVTVRKAGYSPSTVSVSVREDRVARASVLLEEDSEEAEPAPLLAAEVVEFWNVTSGDSAFVEVEYRVRNLGSVATTAYEVYFQIRVGAASYFHEEGAEGLGVGQADGGRFRTWLPQSPASAVIVDGVWSDPPGSTPADSTGGAGGAPPGR